MMPPARMPSPQFEDFNAAALFCPRCQRSMPVRESLLLILPDGYLFEYRCAQCGTRSGEKKVSLAATDKRLF